MFANLNLVWKPSANEPLPSAGKGPAIVRGDTYAHTIAVTDGVLNGYDTWDWAAQIRTARLTTSVSPEPLAEFMVTTEADGDDLLVHLGMAATTTIALPVFTSGAQWYWDLQLSSGDVVATWLAGLVKVLDDVTRASA